MGLQRRTVYVQMWCVPTSVPVFQVDYTWPPFYETTREPHPGYPHHPGYHPHHPGYPHHPGHPPHHHGHPHDMWPTTKTTWTPAPEWPKHPTWRTNPVWTAAPNGWG